ncbi:MAG: OmpA family protein [Paracoccaceae bacterium]
MKNILKLTAAASVLLTAGCLDPAGTMRNESSFAEAAAANQFAQTAYLDPATALKTLDQRFRKAVPTMINFDFNVSTLDAEAQTILRRQAEWVKRYPMVRFKVFGHTDKVGSNGYNNSLGMRRARAAVRYLVAQGVPRRSLIAAVSRGEREPLVNTEDRERLNRRTVTVVAGYVKGYRGHDFDGKVANAIYGEYVGGSAVEE